MIGGQVDLVSVLVGLLHGHGAQPGEPDCDLSDVVEANDVARRMVSALRLEACSGLRPGRAGG